VTFCLYVLCVSVSVDGGSGVYACVCVCVCVWKKSLWFVLAPLQRTEDVVVMDVASKQAWQGRVG
jgi:hypothetical protein